MIPWQAAYVAEGVIVGVTLCWLRWRSPWASPRTPVFMPLFVGCAIWAGIICAVCIGCARQPMPPASSPTSDRYGWQPVTELGEQKT